MPKHQFTCAVQPEYQSEQSQPEAGQYVFAYTVTVSNTGAVAAQLVARGAQVAAMTPDHLVDWLARAMQGGRPS